MRRLITTDSHLVPPPWLLNELPERLQDKVAGQFVRYEVRDGQGFLTFPPDKLDMMTAMGLPPEIPVGDTEEQLVKILNFAMEVDATPYFDPIGRLKDMERENVIAAVLIGNPAFGLHRGAEEVEAQIAYCQLVNDWLADTYKDHLGVFAPGIYLPYLDPAACATELVRCAAKGMRPGLLPDGIVDAPFWQPEWEPLWEAAHGLKVPLTMHIAALRHKEHAEQDNPTADIGYPGASIDGFYDLSCGMGRSLAELAMSGMFQKYPDLHVVMTEGSAFWLAGLMQFCDHYWDSRFGRATRLRCPMKVDLEMPPSYYMKTQGHATFMWDPIAIRLRDLTGVDSLLWGNDYPHPEGVFPDSQAYVDKQFAGVPEDEIEKMTFSTAKELFGFTV